MCDWGNLNPALHRTVELFDVVFFFQGLQLVSGQHELGVLSYSSVPKPRKTAELPDNHPLPLCTNVDQINPAAAMFSLDNQLTLQVLKTDTLVSSPSQTWTVFPAPCCLLLFVWLCQVSNDKKICFLQRRAQSAFFLVITSRCAESKKTTLFTWRCNINTFVT